MFNVYLENNIRYILKCCHTLKKSSLYIRKVQCILEKCSIRIWKVFIIYFKSKYCTEKYKTEIEKKKKE